MCLFICSRPDNIITDQITLGLADSCLFLDFLCSISGRFVEMCAAFNDGSAR